MLNIQEQGGITRTVEAAVKAVHELLPEANAWARSEQPASKISLAMECGGSDGNSGVTANPALGVAADLIVAQGGSAFLGETTEIYGAEHLLTRRAVSREVGEKLIERIKWWEWYTGVFGAKIDNNPSPGNKAGGLTTIYEKSLGALAKAGSTALVDVVPYAARVDKPGLVFMDTPGYDPPCTTGLIAGGANVLVFTTGRGSVLGLKPTPCIKVATNTPMYERMIDDMDLDAGPDPRGRAGRERGPPPLRPDPGGGQRDADPERAAGGRRGGVRAMVDRPDPLSRTVPAAGTGSGSSPARYAPSLRILLPAIACLELLWLGWYLYVPLPSYPTVVIRRGHLLLKTFPEVVRDTTFRQSMLGKGLMELSHFENLPQRLPTVLAAALIAAAAIGIGDLTTGLLGIRHRLRWPVRIALDYGLGAAILGVLTLIAGRMGWLDPWFFRIGLGSLAGLGLFGCRPWRRSRDRRDRPGTVSRDSAESARGSAAEAWLFGLLIAPFVTITILGSMLPATDFDVLEYHLQGPKEYFQAGRIHYLPHNIYTNMPFDVEMLHLLGMEVMADWWWGALPGQLLVALFGPAAAVLIHATAARFSSRAGWFAALVYLSTPWVYRFGVIAYVEGPLCFYQAALVWAWLALPTKPVGKSIAARSLLIGLLAGRRDGLQVHGPDLDGDPRSA